MRRALFVIGLGAAVGVAWTCSPFSGAQQDAADASAGVDAAHDAPSAAADGAAAVDGATDAGLAADGAPVNPASYQPVVLVDTPLVYYPLEEPSGSKGVTSLVASSPSAVVVGAPTLGVDGRVGHACFFADTAPAYLDLSAAGFDFTQNKPYSLEAWFDAVKVDGNYRHVFIKDTNDQASNRQEYGLYVIDDGGTPTVGFERIVNGNNTKVTAPFTTGTWNHVVGVYDGTALSIWLNGVMVQTKNDAASAQTKDKDLLMGTRDPMDNEFPGTIDELAIYGHAMSGARIMAHFAVGKQ